MECLDLTESYLSKYVEGGDRASYERSFPQLFDHYYTYWASRERTLCDVSPGELQRRKMLIDSSVHDLIEELSRLSITVDRIRLVYFVGVGTTNGHAFENDGYYHVWLPLETYTTTRRTDVFVTHALLHALHYRDSPDFYFNSKSEQIQVARQLITEGVASYLTAKIGQVTEIEALWADYISQEDARRWWSSCVAEEAKLYRLIAHQYQSSNSELGLFYADDPTNIYGYRAGYFTGLRLVAKFANTRQFTGQDLLGYPRSEFERGVFDMLL